MIRLAVTLFAPTFFTLGAQAEMKPEHLFVETNQVRLHVVAAGPQNGPLIIFLHGFPEFWRSWKQQLEHFATRGYRVLVPDQRGYNLSEKPDGVEAYKVDHLTQDVIGLIDWAGREKAVVVGHDWGATVAWWVGIKHPERVEKLVILDGPHPKAMEKRLKSDLGQLRKSWYAFYFQIPKLPEWMMLGNSEDPALAKLMVKEGFSAEEVQEYVQAWKQPKALTSMVNWYRAGLRYPSESKHLTEVNVPTLVIWGKPDRFLKTELAEQSLSYCKDGRLVLVDASHWLPTEKPAEVSELIESFLATSQR